MILSIKCSECRGSYEPVSKTRRRIIYKCNKCGKELPVRKKTKTTELD